ncbi:MAG: hypothetical protein AAF485_27555, partial [Chloroflexota bacterium]
HVILALQEAVAMTDRFDPAFQHDWESEIARLKQVCKIQFWDGALWHDDLERATTSQLSTALALRVGCIPEEDQNEQLELIISRSLDLNDEQGENKIVLASPFMHHYLFETLSIFGRQQAILNIILARWGRWVDQGEVTTWENWNIDFPDGSACHAFSAHPRYHIAQTLNQLSQPHF